jgi:uncharacterized membrane protein
MASTAPTSLGRRLRLAVAGAVVLTALSAATAAAVVPPVQTSAPPATRPDPDAASTAAIRARLSDSTGPRSPVPRVPARPGPLHQLRGARPGRAADPPWHQQRGLIVGEYIRGGDDGIPDSESGFLRDQRGRLTVLDVPGAKGTEAARINDRGQIVGEYSQDTPIVNNSARVRGYLWDRGKLTRIDAPGAVGTTALGVNNRAQVVGAYWQDDGTAHGYLWDRGRFTTIDVPGAAVTQPLDINDRGQVVGFYLDDLTGRPGSIHGYLWERGRLVTIDAPDAPVTLPFDINNRGQIVGQLRTDVTVPPAEDPGTGGFLLAKGVTGPFTPVGFPGAPRSVAYGLNDRGQIVGLYENPAATPGPQPTTTPPMGRMA